MRNQRLIVIGGVAGGASAAVRARGFIPGSRNIPLDELRQRLNELPRDHEIIAYCRSRPALIQCDAYLEATRLPRAQPHGFVTDLDKSPQLSMTVQGNAIPTTISHGKTP